MTEQGVTRCLGIFIKYIHLFSVYPSAMIATSMQSAAFPFAEDSDEG